jgi:hypothetical protein
MLKGPVTATAGGHLELASLGTLSVQRRADMQALDQAAARDRLGQFLDRDAGLDAADVGLGKHQLVEGDVA